MDGELGARNSELGTILIQDVTAIPMVRREVLEHVDILIEGSRIAAIGPTGTLAGAEGPGAAPRRPGVQRLVDGRGKLALPGLVNCHNHAGLALFKASSEAMPLEPWLSWLIPLQVKMDPDDLHWSTALACLEQIRAGITTFADMLYLQEHCAPAVEESGLRAVLAMSVMERDPWDDNPAEGLERLEVSLDFARRWQGRSRGRISSRLAPHSVYTVRPTLLAAFAKLAAREGLGIEIHCAETKTEVANCLERHGRTPVGLLAEAGCLEVPILLAHGVHLSDADIELIDRPGVGLSHNPGSNLKLQSGRARLPELAGRGLAVGLGTDSAASNDSLDLLKELYLAAVIHDWPTGSNPSWQVLEMATIGGARALGLDAEIGSLEPGKRADLILLDLAEPRSLPGAEPVRQLAYTARGEDVVTTIVDGEILMDERVVSRLDSALIMKECRARIGRLLSA